MQRLRRATRILFEQSSHQFRRNYSKSLSMRMPCLSVCLQLPLFAIASSAILLARQDGICEARDNKGDAQDVESEFSMEKSTIVLDAEESGVVASSSSVKMYSSAAYRANSPIEDRKIIKLYPNGDVFAGVFDGHGGWQVSNYLNTHLIDYVRQELGQNRQTGDSTLDLQDSICGSLQRAFMRTDRDLAARVRLAFELGFGAVGRCGSCALLVYIHENLLSVANAGDIRCVLGSRKVNGGDSVLIAKALSNDHNAMSATEQKKLVLEHPGEVDAYKCRHPQSCYVKGVLQPTRAFGDFALKYSEFNGPPYVNGDRSAGRHIRSPYTPPYISSKPEVTTHFLTKDDAFVIIGSDGLWDYTENDEAVSIVQTILIENKREHAARALVENVLQKAARRYEISLSSILKLPPGSVRRRHHDDISVIVLFFDQESE
uniref:Protein phosphatase 2C putative n=1 Tax=Albugo laibachii Nc14 TaxID=890382 RepID=F0WBP4_9STRA|nr:protein phosphatase 2C putative [Albugo laibachii Nc14]CCA20529.1 protein phosphatase 2C putative [Albugo laibachii Nc14]|eukprot:CCA20529.1 protein phosphatase 2C putative [Albugo laibachii Nc14]